MKILAILFIFFISKYSYTFLKIKIPDPKSTIGACWETNLIIGSKFYSLYHISVSLQFCKPIFCMPATSLSHIVYLYSIFCKSYYYKISIFWNW
jgi:hypothetical protein